MPLQSVRPEPVRHECARRDLGNDVGMTQSRSGVLGTVLLLQGPVGGFFGALARQAETAGNTVINVHFNLADRLSKSGGEMIAYTGTEGEWERWLEALCQDRKPDVVLMFGDRRPVHVAACQVADRLGIPLYSFEEGYLRPDFVTLERGGNNARSPLPRNPLAYGPIFGPESKVIRVGSTFWGMTLAACAYFIALAAGKRLYPHYRHHRIRPLGSEAGNWLRNVARKLGAHNRDTRLQEWLVAERSKAFFVVALQVHDDLQAVHHGAGWTQERLVENAILSFAAHAPPGTELVLRSHPYDRGHRSYDALVAKVAGAAGVAERVHLMQSGHGPTLLMHARGLVTVNSTMALSAMYHGCPVYALGDSFYRIPGLIAAGEGETGMAAFWREPGEIDANLYQAFAARLRSQVLINGSFYRRRHWAGMIDAVLCRLASDAVGAGQPAALEAVVPPARVTVMPAAYASSEPVLQDERRAC